MKSFHDIIKKRKQKLRKMKDIGRKGFYFFQCESITYMQQHNLKEKYYIFERLRLKKTEEIITNKLIKLEDIEYRIGYYIVGKIGRGKNRWVWGQFCPMIPEKDFDKLIKKAKKEKTLL